MSLSKGQRVLLINTPVIELTSLIVSAKILFPSKVTITGTEFGLELIL